MPVKYIVTITSVGSSSVIVMPKPVLEGFGLKKGQKIEMVVKDDGIYIPLQEQDRVNDPQVKEEEIS